MTVLYNLSITYCSVEIIHKVNMQLNRMMRARRERELRASRMSSRLISYNAGCVEIAAAATINNYALWPLHTHTHTM